MLGPRRLGHSQNPSPQDPAQFSDTLLVLGVVADGVTPLSYQWQFNGANLVGATNSILVLTNLQVGNSGRYSAVVTNRLGLINSAEASIVVVMPPRIDIQPLTQIATVSSSVRFGVAAPANPPPSYQWLLNGTKITGATESTLTLTNLQPTDGGSYSVVVKNIGGAVNSDIAGLVIPSPRLPLSDNLRDRIVTNSFSSLGSANSTNGTKEVGEPDHVGKPGRKSLWLGWRAPANGVATFSTRGSGFDTLLAVYTNAAPNLPPDYSNLRFVAGDDDRGGFATSEVAFSAAAGVEYLIVVDGFGKSSGNIVLSWKFDPVITEAPRIFQQPLGQTVAVGEMVSFSVTAFSTRPLTYQWYQNCAPIPGATNATLTVTNVQAHLVARYRVQVGNGQEGVESEPAFLEINFSGDAGLVQKVASRDKLAEVVVIGGNVARASWPAGSPGVPPGERSLLSQTGWQAGKPALLSPGFGGAPARGFVGTQIFHTFGKTKEIGDPNHAGEPGGASAWYSVLADEDGKMLVSTEGSDFDTVLAVYEGPPNPLGYDELVMPALASDNNRGFDRKSSRVIFDAAPNRTYHIAVDGVSGVQGQVVLTYQLGSPPELAAQPASGVWKVGNVVILEVRVRSRVPVVYQWRLNGLLLSGATNATLVIPVLQLPNVGKYSCVVSNFAGVATSADAQVSVELTEALRLSGRRLPDGSFGILIGGTALTNAVLQASTDLINWLPVYTNAGQSGFGEYIDRSASNHFWRYYRAVR